MLDRKTKTKRETKRKQFYKGTIQSRAPNKPEELSLKTIKFEGEESNKIPQRYTLWSKSVGTCAMDRGGTKAH